MVSLTPEQEKQVLGYSCGYGSTVFKKPILPPFQRGREVTNRFVLVCFYVT